MIFASSCSNSGLESRASNLGFQALKSDEDIRRDSAATSPPREYCV